MASTSSLAFWNLGVEFFRRTKGATDYRRLFAIAMLARLAVLWSALVQVKIDGIATLAPDGIKYLEAAHAILNGSGAGESTIFLFGPGFPVILAILLKLFHGSLFAVLVLQTVLSSLSCLLIYRLAIQLTGKRWVGVFASLVAAASLTSINLSCVFLSDTVYLFLFLCSLVLFIGGFHHNSWLRFMSSALLLSAAVLTRTIGQFWFLALILIAIVLWVRLLRECKVASQRTEGRLVKVAVCLAIVVAAMLGWGIRNHVVHGVSALAMTGAGGPANVAAMTLHQHTGEPYRQIEDRWMSSCADSASNGQISLGVMYRLFQAKTSEVFREYPLEMLKTYAGVVWQNLNEIDYLHRDLLPRFAFDTINWDHFVNESGINYLPFLLAMVGLLMLLASREFGAALILSVLYLYYASMIGFTLFQGSRLFHPGLPATAILVGYLIWRTGTLLAAGVRRIGRALNISERLTWLSVHTPGWLRGFASLYVAISLVSLGWLFRDFIFSNEMLNSNDILGFGLSHRLLLKAHLLAAGSIPHWDPYVLCGVPFVEAIHGGIFYPLTVIDFLGNMARMVGFNFILHFFLSGLFTYFAARQLKLSPLGSLIAATAYAFSPMMISWVAPGHDGKIFCATLFPLTILFADRVFEQPGILSLLFLGVSIAAVIVTPHLQMALYILLFLSVFATAKSWKQWRSGQDWRRPILNLSKFAVAILLGLVISAIQWIPSELYVRKDSPRAGDLAGFEFARSFSLHPEELVSMVWPEFCGADQRPDERTYWGRNSFKDNSESSGTITFGLAVLALVIVRSRRKFLWAGVAVVATAYALGEHTPLLRLLVDHLPVFGSLRAPSTIMFIPVFAISLLAGMGVQAIESRPPLDPRGLTKLKAYFFWLGTFALLAVAVLMSLKAKGLLANYASLFYPDLLKGDSFNGPRWEIAMTNVPHLISSLWWKWLVVSGSLALVAYSLRQQARAFLLSGLAIAIVLVNGPFLSRFIRVLPIDPPADSKLVQQSVASRAGNNRVVGFALNQNQFQIGWYPIQSTIGYQGNEPRWYYRLAGREDQRNFFQARFANLTGTRYVLYPRNGHLNLDTLGPIRMDTSRIFDETVLFENRNAYPRAYLVDSVVVESTLAAVQLETVFGKTDLRRIALLEEHPQLPISPSGHSVGNAEIIGYDDDSVAVEVHLASNALLILTDNYYSAWQAYVDGRPTKTYRAYGSFRAVEVPPGSTRVLFRYESVVYDVARDLSLAGLLVAAGLFAYDRRKQRRIQHFHENNSDPPPIPPN